MIVDFHSHYLPGIDDGAASPEVSLAMLAESAAQGVELCVATPHFYANHCKIDEYLENRRAARDRLSAAAKESKLPLPRMLIGAEVAFFPGVSKAGRMDSLCLEGSNLFLLELPFAKWDESIFREVEELSGRYRLMLAHLDRYLPIGDNHFWIENLLQLPLIVQINAESLTGFWTRRKVRKRIPRDFVMGSDMHNMSSRAPNIQAARRFLSPEETAMVDEYSESLIKELTEEWA